MMRRGLSPGAFACAIEVQNVHHSEGAVHIVFVQSSAMSCRIV
jgi:hypothetical protein